MAKIHIRPSVVLIHQDRLLLLRQRTWRGDDLWVLPGGKLEHGESLVQGAARETLEETGLTVRVGRLLYVSDFIIPGKHNVDMAFHAELVSGELTPQPTEIDDARWVSLDKLPDYNPVPTVFFEQILADAPHGSPRQGVYLGHYG
jgi:ADP-ribose pyrophosphatase YjhB (NUDIX family)